MGMHTLESVHLSPLGRKIVDTLHANGEMSTHDIALALYGDIADNPNVRRTAMKVIAKTVTDVNERLTHTKYTITRLGDHLTRTYILEKVKA